MASPRARQNVSAAAIIYSLVSEASGGHCVQINVTDPKDISTYTAAYDETATAEQKASGDAAITSFDLAAWANAQTL